MSQAYSDKIYVTEAQFDALVGLELGLEYIDGRLVQVAATFAEHGAMMTRLARIIGNYLDENNLGSDSNLMLDTLHRIPSGRRRAPDVAYHGEIRESLKKVQTYAPDLAIEIRSDSEMDDEIEDKLNDLFSLRTPVIWVISLKDRNVKVYKSWIPDASLVEQECQAYVLGDILDASPIIPGLSISISELFDF